MNPLVLVGLAGPFAYAAAHRLIAKDGHVSGKEARRLVADGALLLDVRTPAEFAEAHLPSALNIPVGELPRRLDTLDKHQPIVVYCRSGARAAIATRTLKRAGFTVHDLGPHHAWRRDEE